MPLLAIATILTAGCRVTETVRTTTRAKPGKTVVPSTGATLEEILWDVGGIIRTTEIAPAVRVVQATPTTPVTLNPDGIPVLPPPIQTDNPNVASEPHDRKPADVEILVGVERGGSNEIYYFPRSAVESNHEFVGKINIFPGDVVRVVRIDETMLATDNHAVSSALRGSEARFSVAGNGILRLPDTESVPSLGTIVALGNSRVVSGAESYGVAMLTRNPPDRGRREHFIYLRQSIEGDQNPFVNAFNNSLPMENDHIEFMELTQVPVIASHLIMPLLRPRGVIAAQTPDTIETVVQNERCDFTPVARVLNCLNPLCWVREHRIRNLSVQQEAIPMHPEALAMERQLGGVNAQIPHHCLSPVQHQPIE
ncbi:MAG: hypothetical protein NT069_24630 [Planctomycetota bacterium]|nr:hypothetical protein [Planctomycetota bacterium]